VERIAPDWLTSTRYAHRGLHSPNVPENSRGAAKAAIAAGLGIECDVQMSQDSVPFVFHDWDLDRLTGRRGKVAQLSSSELSELDLVGSGERSWTLADLLELVAGQVPVLIEVKARPHLDMVAACASIAALIRSYEGPIAVMSFDARVGQWFEKHEVGVLRGLVATDTLDIGFRGAWRSPGAMERAQPDFLACDIRDLPNAFARLWRETGRPLLAWTVRTRALAERAKVFADAAIAEGEGLT